MILLQSAFSLLLLWASLEATCVGRPSPELETTILFDLSGVLMQDVEPSQYSMVLKKFSKSFDDTDYVGIATMGSAEFQKKMWQLWSPLSNDLLACFRA